MITECQVWRGFYQQVYQEDIDAWLAESDVSDVSVVRCAEVDPRDIDCSMFEDEVGFLSGTQTVLLVGLQYWYADTTAYTLKRYAEMETEYRLGLVYHQEEPTKAVTDIADDIYDGRLDTDPELLAKWARSWLESHGVLVSKAAVREAARRAGSDDLEVLIDGIQTLIDGFQGRIDDDRFLSLIDGLGATEGYRLTTAITEGNRSQVAELLVRLRNHEPLGLVAMLTNRFRQYVILAADPDADITVTFRVSPGMAYHLKREAAKLGPDGAVRGMELLTRASLDLKGGSTLDQWTLMGMLSDQLALLFSIDRSKTRRGRGAATAAAFG